MSELEKWIESRPQNIQEVIRKLPPTGIYKRRSLEESPEYWIVSYDEEKDGSVTLTIGTEGLMSPLTGRTVFGIKPDELDLIGDRALRAEVDINGGE